jgi:hypothetical protein
MASRLNRTAKLAGGILLMLALTTKASLAQSWTEYSYPSAGFAVSGPIAPVLSKQGAQSESGPIETRFWSWNFPTASMLIGVADYASMNYSERDLLDRVADNTVKGWRGGRVVSRAPIVQQGVAGVDCIISSDEYQGRLRVFVQARRIWWILSLASTGQALYSETDRLFASFRFVTP